MTDFKLYLVSMSPNLTKKTWILIIEQKFINSTGGAIEVFV